MDNQNEIPTIDPEEMNAASCQILKVAKALAADFNSSLDGYSKSLCAFYNNAKKYYAEHKDEIDAATEKALRESENLQKGMPRVRVGDIVRIDSVHTEKLNCYEVDSVQTGGVVSQPAGFFHENNEIVAVYRFDGLDFKCIWERKDYKEYKKRLQKSPD